MEPASRFLSEAECFALFKRAQELAVGGGDTALRVVSTWTGNLRWARNLITTTGDIRNNDIAVDRSIRGARVNRHGFDIATNQIDDVGLEAAIRRSERLLGLFPEDGGSQFEEHFITLRDNELKTIGDVQGFKERSSWEAGLASLVQTPEPYLRPHIFFDTTYNLDAEQRAAALDSFIATVKSSGMVAAGYLQVEAYGQAVLDVGRTLYYPMTTAQFSVTVRTPDGSASGWAGVDWNDWTRIDGARLSETALDKCMRSRNPVAVEPGRYTTILEPQAAGDLFEVAMKLGDRQTAESLSGPFASTKKHASNIGSRIFDSRITVTADPMDPDLGFMPFDSNGNVYHPATWVENGVLKALPYYRPYAIQKLGLNSGLPSSGACRVSGGTTSIDEMIATTERGLLVTRFSNLSVVDIQSALCTGYTRDGFWLIEKGKIKSPIKNFQFLESVMFVFNNIDQIGVPVRIFHPGAPMIVPPIKVRDFNFTRLSGAV